MTTPRFRRVRLVLSSALLLLSSIMVAQPDRSAPPKLGPPPSLRLPAIQHMTLSNGIRVLILEKHAVPVVQVNLVVKAGTSMDPAGKSGLASLTAAMLTDGAGARNALQLADAIDFLGARIGASAGQHTTGVQMNVPVVRLDSALALLADVARRPGFPPAELERKRKERLTTLVQWHDEPTRVAGVAFARALYGTAHPYGTPTIGSEASLRSITTDDLRKFHAGYFVPANITVIVVGDVAPAAIMSRLETAFGAWKGKPAAAPALPAIRQIAGTSLTLVDKPDAAQSVIMIGRVGVPRTTDDYYAITVMNTILGGSFSSRLNQNLREKHGYTYGAASSFDFRPLAGPFVARASVQTAVTDKALGEFMNELRGILQEVPEEEVARARNYLALGYPGDFQSVGQIAAQLEELVIYNLPDDYFNKYIGRVLAVTKEQVRQAAEKYIVPDTLAFVVVGDRKEIEEGINGLALAPVTVRSIEDILGPAPDPGR
jgi:zinc protease